MIHFKRRLGSTFALSAWVLAVLGDLVGFVLSLMVILGSSSYASGLKQVHVFKYETITMTKDNFHGSINDNAPTRPQSVGLYDEYTVGVAGLCGHNQNEETHCFPNPPSPFWTTWDQIVGHALRDHPDVWVDIPQSVIDYREDMHNGLRAFYVFFIIATALAAFSLCEALVVLFSGKLNTAAFVSSVVGAVALTVAAALGTGLYADYKGHFDNGYMHVSLGAVALALTWVSLAALVWSAVWWGLFWWHKRRITRKYEFEYDAATGTFIPYATDQYATKSSS